MMTGTMLLRANLREQVDAVHLRHHRRRAGRGRALAPIHLAERLAGIGGLDDVVALVAEQARHQGPNLRIIVDHQHQRYVVSHSR